MKSISRAMVLVLGALWSQAASAQIWSAVRGGAGGAAGAATSGVSNAGPPAAGAAPAPAPSPGPATPPTPAAAAAGTAPTTSSAAVAAPAPVPAAPNTGTLAAPPKPAGGDVVTSGAGLSPNLPQVSGGTNLSTKQVEELTPSTAGAADEWKFQFHGYLRAPVRFSWGPPTPAIQPSIYNPQNNPMGDPRPLGSFRAPYAPGEAPPPGTQLHGLPRVPGYNYTGWEYTNTIGGPWSQLNFSYGNSRVMGTVIVDSYNQTDGGYRNLQAQQGIDQVFLTVNVPDAFGDRGGLVWNIGSFANRYGVAGKYDAGMYETYLFGRTHIAGSTWTANLSNIDAAGDWSLVLEAGFGSKLDIVPFLNNQNYQIFQNVPAGTNIGSPYLTDRSPDYLPWAGSVPQGSTYLHHEHLVAKYRNLLTFGAHYLFTWTPDDNWSPINSRQVSQSMGSPSLQYDAAVPRAKGPIQGSMEVWGGEVKLSGGSWGDGYLGYAHIDARNINALAEALEIGHSYGGPGFKQNYFGRSFNGHTGVYNGPQNETGIVHNISAQYSFSFGAFAKAPEEFWGEGTDLVLTAFGFLSIVDSKAPPIAIHGDPAAPTIRFDPARATTWDMSTKKLKFGFDAIYTPLSWMAVGGRYDNVQPDLDSAYSRTPAVAGNMMNVPLGNPGGSDLSFSLLTGRVVFKTEFITHETITLLYSHYFLGDAAYPAFPYEWVARADADAVSLSGTLWW